MFVGKNGIHHSIKEKKKQKQRGNVKNFQGRV